MKDFNSTKEEQITLSKNYKIFEVFLEQIVSGDVSDLFSVASYTENGVTHYYTVTTKESFLMGKYGGAKVTTH